MIAHSLNHLAVVYADQNKYAQAESLHQRALALRERVLGPDHPDVATSLDTLAKISFHQGTYHQAESH